MGRETGQNEREEVLLQQDPPQVGLEAASRRGGRGAWPSPRIRRPLQGPVGTATLESTAHSLLMRRRGREGALEAVGRTPVPRTAGTRRRTSAPAVPTSTTRPRARQCGNYRQMPSLWSVAAARPRAAKGRTDSVRALTAARTALLPAHRLIATRSKPQRARCRLRGSVAPHRATQALRLPDLLWLLCRLPAPMSRATGPLPLARSRRRQWTVRSRRPPTGEPPSPGSRAAVAA